MYSYTGLGSFNVTPGGSLDVYLTHTHTHSFQQYSRMLASQPYHSNRNHRLQARPSKMKRNWLSALTDNKNIAYYSEIVAASQLRSVRSVCILQDNLVQPPFLVCTRSAIHKGHTTKFLFLFLIHKI